MVINTNVEAQRTANNLNVSQTNLAKSLSRLSSGSRIVNPSDDAAGLAVSSRLRAQIKRLDSALSNVINAVSFTQTQDGFMKTVDKAFRRMGELAMLARDETKSSDDRALYDQEFQQLKDYIIDTTDKEFNSVELFNGADIDVTIDSEGDVFQMAGIDMQSNTKYQEALFVGDTITDAIAEESDETFTVSGGHGLTTGDIVRLNPGDGFDTISELTGATDYYVNASSGTVFTLHLTAANTTATTWGPARALRLSNRHTFNRLHEVLHEQHPAGQKKVTLINCNSLCRIDMMRPFDGTFSEGDSLNMVAWNGEATPE